MADTRVKIVDIQVRYEQAVDGMAKYRQSLAEAKKYQQDLKNELKAGNITQQEYDRALSASQVYVRQQGDALRTLQTQVNNQVKAEQEQEGSLKQLRAQLSQATAAYDGMSRAERQSAAGRELRDKINNITNELKAAEAETQRFYRNVGNYQEAAAGLDKLSDKINGVGKALLAAAGIGSAMGFSKDVLQVTRDFEDAIARVKAVTNGTPEQLQMMTDKARELGRTTIYHATDAANALETLSRGGFTAQEATDAVSKTLMFAQANVIGLNDAADIMIRTMRGFKMPITEEEMTRANDVLSKVSASSATNVLEIAEAMKNAAPFGSTLGQSIEEVSASLGVLADVGVRGADAGTALRMVMLGLATETPKQQKVFKEFGIEITQQSLASEGLTKTLQRLKDSGIMEAEDSANKLAAVFGRRCTPQVMALVGNIDRLDEKLVTLGGKVTTYGEQADAIVQATGQPLNQINATLAQLEDAGVKGEEATNIVKAAYAGLTEQTESSKAVFDQLGVTINQQTVEADGLSGTLQKLKDAGILEAANSTELLAQVFGNEAAPQVRGLIENVGDLQQKFEDLNNADVAGTTARMFKDSYSEVSQEIFTLSSAWESFKISLGESSNEGLIEPIRMLTEAVRFLEENVDSVISFVVTAIASISFAKLISGAQSAFLNIRNSAVTNAEQASTRVRTLQQQEITLRKTVAQQVAQIEQASGTERTMLEAKVLENKRTLANTEKALVKAKTQEIQMWESAAAVNSGSAWKSAMAASTLAVRGFVTASKTALKGFIFTAVIMLAFEAIQKFFNYIKGSSDSTFGKMLSSITGLIKNGINWLITQFQHLINWVKDFTENSRVMQALIFVVKTQLTALGLAMKSVWSVFKFALKEIVGLFKALMGIVGGVGTALEGLFTLNWTQLKRGIKQVGTSVTDFFKSTGNNATAMWDELKKNGEDAANQVKSAFDNAYNSAAFAGKETKKTVQQPSNTPQGGDSNGAQGSAGATDDEPAEPTKSKYSEEAKRVKADWDEAKAYYQQLIKDQNATTEDVLAARKDMQEAQKAYEDLTGDKQSKSGGGGKQDNAAKKRAELEQKAFEEAEKAMLALMHDTAAKRRAQLESQYNNEIARLKVKLATEKNLTDDAKEALNRAILLKEKKRDEELAKLDEEELKRDIANRKKLLDSRLALARKGSAEELEIKKQKIADQLLLDTMELEREKKLAEEDAEDRLKRAIAAHGAESDEAQAARERLMQIQVDYLERIGNMQELARRNELEAEQKHQQDLMNIRQQAYQNQITQIEIANQERLLKEQEDAELYLTQQEGIQMLNLQVVTQGEMDVLAVRQQAAEQKYNDIVAQGQLEGETTEAYNARVLAAEKAKVDAKAKYREAEIKNEKAYYNASKALTNSLISLTAAIGESDEEFAKISKLLTLVQITIDTGKALSGGIASASRLPYPANLAAIATTVATVLANIATAVSTVKSAKFAEGGKVYGPGTGTSDSIPAKLSAGEFVMTAKATRLFEPLLFAMNGIGRGVAPMVVSNAYRDYNTMPTEELRQSFTEAVANIHPVVSVVDINEAQERVTIIESLDNI